MSAAILVYHPVVIQGEKIGRRAVASDAITTLFSSAS